MTAAACKAAICDDEAQGRMVKAINKIDSIKGATVELRVQHSEIYISALKEAQKKADQVVMESGQ